MKNIIKVSTIYRHKKGGGLYKVVGFFKNLLIQYNGEWLPSVLYRAVPDSVLTNIDTTSEYVMDPDALDFIRSQKEFLDKFEEVR